MSDAVTLRIPASWRRRLTGAAVLVLLGSLAAIAEATGDRAKPTRQTVASVLETERVDRPTGTRVQVDYLNPSDPEGKPPAVRRVEVRDPRGTVIDTSVPGRCEASDAELMAEGEAACPADSLVGDGYLRVDTGVPGPERMLEADILLLNQTDEIIFLSTVRGSGARVVSRASVEGRTVTIEVPLLPGTPPDGAALDEAETHLERISGPDGTYIRTPPTCPRRGWWTIRHRFTYDDGVTEIARSRSTCSEEQR